MEGSAVIEARDVSVTFRLERGGTDTLKEYVIRLLRGSLRYEEFHALSGVTLTVRKGERVGILGLNGAGKSTLLKVVAGVYRPTGGSIAVRGSVAPLLELGAGFDGEYTARENVFLYGAMLGYGRRFLEERLEGILAFAELEEFADVPVKGFSSGMRSRLGFAICTAVEPDILILDEVLSVGDARFRRKSEARIRELFGRGVTVLFVSHSVPQVRGICDRAVILERGRVVADGESGVVCGEYERMCGGGQ